MKGKKNLKLDEKTIKKEFLHYSNLKTKKIELEGMEKLGKKLGIDIYTDIFITYFFFKCGCKRMEEVSENEFITGLKYFQSNTLKDIKKQIPSIRKGLLDISSNEFKNFYRYLFTFNNTKILSFEVVEVYFNNLFLKKYPIVQFFLQFLKQIKSQGLNKDQWECFLDFLLDQGNTFPKDYNCESYYPLIIDQFYEYYCDLKKIPKKKMEEEYIY